MKKIVISKLFLYRYRFIIGYVILGLAFVGLLVSLPLFAQTGLSEAEMESATNSYYLGRDGILNGDLVDLPYRIVQKFAIMFLGLSSFSVKLPSILVGLLLGLMLILLLNRWFKSNVSLLSSCLIVLSTPFLFLAGSGTPLIMIVFWPTLLLWLGSKIQGEKRPKPLYSFAFAIAMLLSIFTPYMIYFAIFCVLFVMLQPHLRFIVKNLPKLPLLLVVFMIIAGFTLLGISIAHHPVTVKQLLASENFEFAHYFANIAQGFAPVFAWHGGIEGVLLSPLISLPIFALALIGLFSTTKGFFASRNSIASSLLVFCVAITGFSPENVVFLILPFSILTAHGVKYLLEKWYGLFPENPYARISALLPLTVLFGIIITPSLLQYFYGYRYNPNVADAFSYDINIIKENLTNQNLVVADHYDFYKILEEKSDIKVFDKVPEASEIAMLGRLPENTQGYTISRIITSPLRDNSDIIYLYTYIDKGEQNGTENGSNEAAQPASEGSEGA
ncbi:glycosyltransferase family 39 protein [Candidatus Saccharibacteria bacterium]|nr:glycosyltransferase family 39 protein [Candidatus Saccharibacteria bacterium]